MDNTSEIMIEVRWMDRMVIPGTFDAAVAPAMEGSPDFIGKPLDALVFATKVWVAHSKDKHLYIEFRESATGRRVGWEEIQNRQVWC